MAVLNRVPREVTVSLFRLQSLAVVTWFAVMLGVIGTSVALGVPVTAVGVASWLMLGSIPPLVLARVLRGSGQTTVSQVPVVRVNAERVR
jgi:hypothetical protein